MGNNPSPITGLVERLREALKPFADALGEVAEFDPRWSDTDTIEHDGFPEFITVGDLRRARAALSLPQPTIDREAIALALLNSDRGMAGFPPVTSRASIPDSDGYLVNADAILALLHPIDDISEAKP